MKIAIRHQIDNLNEEIYHFDLQPYYIKYIGINFSNRKSETDIWGYDWDKYYRKTKEEECEKLIDEYDDINYDEYDDRLMEYESKMKRLYLKYNPVHHGVLSGTFSNNMSAYPPKLSKDEIKAKMKEIINNMVNNAEYIL